MAFLESVGRRDTQWGDLGPFGQLGNKSLNGRQRNKLFRNNGDGTWSDVAYVSGADRIEDARGLALLDLDADGRQDLLVSNHDRPAVLLMGRGGSGRWLQLRLRGSGKNTAAVGARVIVEAGGRRQLRTVSAGAGYMSCPSKLVHVGLGEATTARVTIHWPSGKRSVRELSANQRYEIREP